MKYRKLGNSEIDISIISLGTMTFGEQNSPSEAFEQMDYAFEKGINYFDTAEIYPVYPKKETHGKSEEIIGEWLKINKNRENMLIEEVEEIWKQIDQENNWHLLEQKISKVRNLGSLLESKKLVNF